MENEKAELRVCNAEDELQEEEKIEKFFSLIRSFQEARNRRREQLNESEEKAKKNKIRRVDNGHEEQSSWVPSFEWQDFTEEIEFRRPPIVLPSPCNKKEEKKRVKDDGLDLKLTL
ncbi:protein NIM1-INTERACTING 1-like [Mangifera indica]|uniref:protein NIM1-INTERACTING 1-like n=1 Tax=Mangifera indica TaxID=29780 RepID=UPI001CFB79A8|nr:protein NIM1-INTERACTING 1-like [Mangifera indica]